MLRKFALALFSLAFAAGILWCFLKNNIHTVIPQQVYRSAQLNPGNLAYLVRREGIRSVINLRGKQMNAAWYDNELALSKKLGIQHYDIPMSAYSVTTPANLKTLVKRLQTAPKPLLLHCQGGADRTGLAAAMALILLNNDPLSKADEQISFDYLVIHADSTGKLTLPKYKVWLEQHNLTDNKANFLAWVKGL